MSFIEQNFTPIGGNSRSGLESSENSTMSWGYFSQFDNLADVISGGYFDSQSGVLSPGDFINCALADGKVIVTVLAVDRIAKTVVLDVTTFNPGAGPTLNTKMMTIEWFVDPLAAINEPRPLLGDQRLISGGLLDAENWSGLDRIAAGTRIAFDVTSFTSGGTLTVRGDSVDKETGVPTLLDTEDIIIDQVGLYITDKHWNANVGYTTSPENIGDYDGNAFHMDFWRNAESSYKIKGFHARIYPRGSDVDVRMRMFSNKRVGPKRYNLTLLEDLRWHNNPGATSNPFAVITDNLRLTVDDRSYDYNDTGQVNPLTNTRPSEWHQEDFDSFFTANENTFDPSIGEGISLFLTQQNLGTLSNPTGPKQLDLMVVHLFLE